MESGIYMLTCRINGHSYIGQSQNIKRRMWEHKHQRNLPHLPISRAIKKYGWENFDKEVLEFCPIDELAEKEIFYIEILRPEYNVSKGGESGMRGYKHSAETKEKCRKAAAKEWQDKSDEEKENVIKTQLTWRFEEGHEVSDEIREKLRQANLGKNRNSNKAVRCVETGEIFQSIKKAALSAGINACEITRVLKGYRNRKTAGGLYHSSVETSRDECSGVGEKMSYSSKCTATLKVEEIVRAVEMVN